MKILSFESSAQSAAVCLTEEERVIASAFQNCGLTHSRTLLPMAEQLLAGCGVPLSAVDGLAVAAGPGSFTGIRIGVATVKGLAMAADKPCAAVSTLEAMAWGLLGHDGEVCCVMDARAGQVYNARFRMTAQGPERRCEDRAVKLETLAQEIGDSAQLLVGDGASLCYTNLKDVCPGLRPAPPHLLYPTGFGVSMAARRVFETGQAAEASALRERYLRAPQAERERLRRLAEPNENKLGGSL